MNAIVLLKCEQGISNTSKCKLYTFPTVEKNSSRSLGRILAASCMQKTVRASLSSGVRLSIGSLKTKNKLFC